MRGGNRRRNWFARICYLLLALAVCISAFGRAGGGHGFSGGGHGGGGGFHSSGGGGHGGGGGDIGPLIYWLLIAHPLIGIPLVILGLFLLYYIGNQSTDTYRANVIKRGQQLINAD